ncbi:hypothetical protein BM221_002773 [Beauveria bassiana]|uniref:Uncharacterized protein n=1 Tax=Beauveria bassiana TaxID=176275 RepID=A0A2N6NST3_BEABA|nr:hypothetical protein BM221_002773 [Beauveria bassiana]
MAGAMSVPQTSLAVIPKLWRCATVEPSFPICLGSGSSLFQQTIEIWSSNMPACLWIIVW